MRRPIPDEIHDLLSDHASGLPAEAVVQWRARFGRNDIVEQPPGGWWALLGDTARDPMLWFLLVTSVLFFFLGDTTEAVVLLVAVLPLVGMDLYLHRRTSASTAGLRSRLASSATVIRNGVEQTIAVDELVVGDLAVVRQGEPFPADGIVIACDNARVDESALTGESWPVRKSPLPPHQPLQQPLDDQHWGLAGTRLLTGSAQLRIAHVGRQTLYGEIVQSAIGGSHARTPLQQAIAQLVTLLLIAASLFCLVLAAVRLHQGYGLVDALLSAVTLAVAALPEEFPVVFTFFLGVGVHRLARHKALVRRAVAVENIGRISAICSDKTGTITEGRLTLTHHHTAPGVDASRLLQIAALASRSESGDPLDSAILATAPDTNQHQVQECFPFTEDRKRETAIVRDNAGVLSAVTKGAVETLLAMCGDDAQRKEEILAAAAAFAAGGHKVIACAWRPLEGHEWPGGEPDRGFQIAGLLALEDPVREGVVEAVDECQRSGIKVLMITGDHPLTAGAIAREIGLNEGEPRVIEAQELEQHLNGNGNFRLHDYDAIARAIPSQKLRLVRRLQQEGMIVAVTGDGVNDVPALQAADIGIAMGERGTRSAREVSSIVLLDDNFSTITQAIAEGRQLFRNLQLSFAWLLMVHIPFVITAALIPLLGYPLLYHPIHVVWLELIIHPTALLVFQQLPEQRISQSRRSPRHFFNRGEWLMIIVVGLLLTALVTATYLRSFGDHSDVEHGRTMAIMTLIIASSLLTAVMSRMKTAMAAIIITLSLALSLLLVQVESLAALLHLSPLHLDDWAIALGGGIIVALLPLTGSLLKRPHR